MSEGWVCDLLANFLGGVGAGLLILWLAERTLEIRKESRRRKLERQAEVRRALKCVELVREEMAAIVKQVPRMVKLVTEEPHGYEIPIVMPVWRALVLSGEPVRLVDPGLLKQITYFYESLDYARRGVNFIVLSWLAPESGVTEIEGKREAFKRMVTFGLEDAQRTAGELGPELDTEVERLETLLN